MHLLYEQKHQHFWVSFLHLTFSICSKSIFHYGTFLRRLFKCIINLRTRYSFFSCCCCDFHAAYFSKLIPVSFTTEPEVAIDYIFGPVKPLEENLMHLRTKFFKPYPGNVHWPHLRTDWNRFKYSLNSNPGR